MGAPATKSALVDKPKDRVELRLYNAIVIYDDYVIAKSSDAARDLFTSAILHGEASPMESVVKEVTMANSIRTSKVEDKPLIGNDITDEEFETLKGITNSAAFERFYLRRS